jgi:glyoxylase-like metal-dependent hydrolase (beta-lactamase superfamily II)
MVGSYRNMFSYVGDGITGISTKPRFAIGQEVYLISTEAGNVMWDCLAFVDTETLNNLSQLGGLVAIAISHPHFIGSAIEWSHRLGGIPVFLHFLNEPWVARPDKVIKFWEGEELEIVSGVRIILCGGHFPGSCVLHWASGAGGKGALFTSDTIVPVEDRRWVSFMYSYPNLIPLGPSAIERIIAVIEELEFDRLYGGPMYGSGGDRPIIIGGARDVIIRSACRYLRHIRE